jgi:DDE superfamily endonuclease
MIIITPQIISDYFIITIIILLLYDIPASTIMTLTLSKRRRIRDRKAAAYVVSFVVAAAITYHDYYSNFNKTPQHTSRFTGRRWMQELLDGHPTRIKDNLGISREGFRYLENLLIRKSNLRNSRYMDTTEQLGIFLYAVVTDLSMRKLAERFQRSTETINRTYHRVMGHFLEPDFFKHFVKFPTESTPLSEEIEDSINNFPYFKDCIGAIDGSHIPISPPDNERIPFRNRKGFLSQNVLAACNFDLKFTMVLSGWEGSVSDSTLWLEGRRLGVLPIPEGKYLLGDAGFANCDTCLTPYRGVRYHLKEWAKGNLKPQNKEELFNLRHSKLRNVIERIFGVCKGRFKILTCPRAFKLEAQARIVAALCVLHNILVTIKEIDPDEEYEEDSDDDEVTHEQQMSTITAAETQRASIKRDEIATAMWNNYRARR